MAEDKKKKAPFAVEQARREVKEAERGLTLAKETKSETAIDDAKKALREAKEALDKLQSGSPEKRAQAREKFMEQYYRTFGPMVEELVTRDPSLRNMFEKAIREDWDQQEFLDELYANKWWNSKSRYWTEAFKLEFESSDAEWKRLQGDAERAIQEQASKFGITIPAERLKAMAKRYYYQGWNKDETALQEILSQEAIRSTEQPAAPGAQPVYSDMTQLAGTLEKYAKDFGLTYEKSWYAKQAAKIMSPRANTTMNVVLQEMAAAAESKNPYFKGKLGFSGAGEDATVTTLRDAAGDYVGSMARLLELDEGSIDMNDDLFRQAFNADVEPGKAQAMSLYEFENMIRADKRWAKTKNAEDQVYDRVNSVLSMFGMR